MAEIALARGELATARKYADEAVSLTNGVYRAMALTARSRVALAEDDVEAAEQDAHAALSTASSVDAHTATPDALECLAAATVAAGGANGLVRLLGAADALRKRMGARRNPVYQSGYDSLVAAVRDLVSADDFAAAWDEGAALSTQDAIAYARRGRGERKRPASGWASLTPTERDVVRLVGDGLANKDIATRLFMSPRTVASHLTHVYAKLAVTSRVQLAQEATRRAR
jgi:DNA-binding CsgD family transcriptional regulator